MDIVHFAPGLRAARSVAEQRSVSAAAVALNRTQSAISKSIGKLETQLGVHLFDRFSRGVELTAYGAVFIPRIREAEAQFKQAGRAHLAVRGKVSRQKHNSAFTMEISKKRFAAFLAVHECREFRQAAAAIGVTRAAVYDSVRHLETLLELPLFERDGSGIRCTPFADTLAGHVRLAFSLMQHGVDEIASLGGATRGQVVVGTLPYSRTVLIPRTIHRVLQAHPQLVITTREGPYDVLERALRNGAIDLIIGATRHFEEDAPLVAEDLFEDELAVICGIHHPPAGKSSVSIEDLLAYGWVLPVKSTPARKLFDAFLARHGGEWPGQMIETASLSTVRGLLLESDRVALLSVHQVQLDVSSGLLWILPIRLEGTFRPIGITTRAHSTPSPAARVFIEVLRDMALEIKVGDSRDWPMRLKTDR